MTDHESAPPLDGHDPAKLAQRVRAAVDGIGFGASEFQLGSSTCGHGPPPRLVTSSRSGSSRSPCTRR